MLFQVLCGFEPIFYTTHPNEEPIYFSEKETKMSSNVKIIANYLPQYHQIPENDKWWGEGFTDWIAVKNATPLFDNHNEPRVPLNNNYYDLSDVEAIRWQAKLAKKYGIYGFGICHYWFSDEMNLLKTPSEIILENKDIDIHFMFIWDNFSWKRTWSKLSNGAAYAPAFDGSPHIEDEKESGILAELKYGTKENWKNHFEYLLRFFKDERYIKVDNRPVFSFYQARNNFPIIKKMTEYWDELAKENGFAGILCLSKDILYPVKLEKRMKYSPFQMTTPHLFLKYKIKSRIFQKKNEIAVWNYDEVWHDVLFEAKVSAKDSYLCGFIDYDDSPRRGKKARIITGATPEKFEKYMNKLICLSKKQNKEFVFLMAWNEWGEGSYLEPDTNNGYKYLEAIRNIVRNEDD